MNTQADVQRMLDDDVPHALRVAQRRLLFATFGEDFSEDDWRHTEGGWRVIGFVDREPVAHAAIVPRVIELDGRPFHAGYVEGVATEAARQGTGLGSAVMAVVGEVLRTRHELGVLSTDRLGFYARAGWERWLGPSWVRDGASIVRTADEDEGLLVLRFGRSGSVDRTLSITCEARAGDAW